MICREMGRLYATLPVKQSAILLIYRLENIRTPDLASYILRRDASIEPAQEKTLVGRTFRSIHEIFLSVL
jgi:hypothetical protein